jgi:hypothetical protein
MSNDMASTDPMLASSGERTRKAGELRDEIYKKLAQAKGICIVICEMHDMAKTPVAASLWAAEELITGVEKAVDELKHIQNQP